MVLVTGRVCVCGLCDHVSVGKGGWTLHKVTHELKYECECGNKVLNRPDAIRHHKKTQAHCYLLEGKGLEEEKRSQRMIPGEYPKV